MFQNLILNYYFSNQYGKNNLKTNIMIISLIFILQVILDVSNKHDITWKIFRQKGSGIRGWEYS